MTIREVLILASAKKSKKKIGGSHAFFLEIIKQRLFSKAAKYRAMPEAFFFFFFFQIKALLSLKNAWLPQMSFFDTKSTWEVLLSINSLTPRKNIPVLVATTHRKSHRK